MPMNMIDYYTSAYPVNNAISAIPEDFASFIEEFRSPKSFIRSSANQSGKILFRTKSFIQIG